MHREKRARWSNATFLVGFVLALALLVWVLKPFIVTLTIAGTIAVLLIPVQERLARLLGGRRNLAAWICAVGAVLLVLAPITLVLIRVIVEAVPAISEIASTLGEGGLAQWLQNEAPRPVRLAYARVLDLGLGAQLRQLLGGLASWLGGFVAGLPSFLGLLVTDGLVLIVALVWFFSSGPFLVRRLIETIPMEPRYTADLFRTVRAGVRTIMLASLLTAGIQGILGFGAFWILRIPYALLLAALMAFFSFVFSLVPVLGSGLVWVPLAVWLAVTGRIVAGIFLFLYGFLVLGSVDNVVKPFFTRDALRLPPAVVFVTVFGGLYAFGPVGALIGPLITALVGAFLRIWREDFLRLPPIPESGFEVQEPHLPPTPYDVRDGEVIDSEELRKRNREDEPKSG